MEIAILGIDLGKSTFHLCGQDRAGHVLLRRKLSRSQLLPALVQLPPCLIVMEACAGAHYLARKLTEMGHQAKLIAAQYVKPFVKGNKNDFIDAEAICEAARRPTMRFVAIKTLDQQALAVLHRMRDGFVRDRTRCMNQVHGFLLEFGLVVPKGHAGMRQLAVLLDAKKEQLPQRFIHLLERLHAHYVDLSKQIAELERECSRLLAEDEAGKRLLTVPGIGPVTASLMVAQIGNATQYVNGRHMAAALGLVPRQHSTGGRPRLLGISKRGDKNLRRLLVQGARAVLIQREKHHDALNDWVQRVMARRHINVAVVALANKIARIAWAVLAKGTSYEPKLM